MSWESLRELRRISRRGGVPVIASDNDSEGELIGLEILKVWRQVNGERPYRRMRFNLTEYRELKSVRMRLEEATNWEVGLKGLLQVKVRHRE